MLYEKEKKSEEQRRRVVLLSGGIDSAYVLSKYHIPFNTICLYVNYGHPSHRQEFRSAIHICSEYRVALTTVCTNMDSSQMRVGEEVVGPRVVPARNMVFCALAANHFPNTDIYIGCTKNDFSEYADCRKDFIEAISLLLHTCSGNRVFAPLLDMTKEEIVEDFGGVAIKDTFSCYEPNRKGKACGKCNSCVEREAAIDKASSG